MDVKTADATCGKFQAMVLAKSGKTMAELNIFTAPATEKRVREDGIVYVNDLCYSYKYPNSFLDIWYASGSGEKRPTVVYFHGGGFLFGDKVEGDPLAKGSGGFIGFLLRVVKEGYNLVSVNYSFAPEYRFPAPIIQGNMALLWLRDNAERLGLDMERVIITGSSAGANMTLFLGTTITNPEYARTLGVGETIEKERIKALFADESALSVGGLSEGIDTMSVSVLGEEDVVNGEKAKLYAAQNHIKRGFFPTFINASNVEPVFYEDAKHTAAALEKVGAPWELFYRTQKAAGELQHGYLELFETNPVSAECLEKVLSFFERYTK